MTVSLLGFGVDWNIEKMVLIGRRHSPRYMTASHAPHQMLITRLPLTTPSLLMTKYSFPRWGVGMSKSPSKKDERLIRSSFHYKPNF